MKIFIFSIILLALQLQYSFPQWEMNSGVTTQLNSSTNSKTIYYNHWAGWACGVNGTVVRRISTSDLWSNISGNGIPTNVNLINICGVDSNIAFTAGYLNSNTWIWKTTNAGQSWNQVFTQPNGRINAVWMRNYLQGFLLGNPVGGRWSIWKTTNGGNNWDSSGLYLPQAGNELGWQNSFCMPMPYDYPSSDSSKIWFGTNNHRIYYSSNYGQSWNIQTLPLEQNIYCIAYLPNFQFAGGSNYVFKSTNYGLNWTTDSITGSGNITGITFCCWSYYLTRENKIYQKMSGNWYPFHTAPAGNYTYVDNRGYGNGWDHYAVRTNGGITYLREGTGVEKISSEIPIGFSLSQNYPNPFNPVTKIKFDVPTSNLTLSGAKGLIVRLAIYDILGREVATLVNEQLNPGTYEVEWSAAGGGKNYSSGVYFYRLITNDASAPLSITKKMVLIK